MNNLRQSFFLITAGLISYFFLDREITSLVSPYTKHYHFLFKGATLCIFPPIYLAASGIGLLFSRLKKTRWTLPFFEIFAAQALSIAFVRVFKILIGRARPDIFLKKGIYGFYGFEWNHHFHSFPSGHTMAAFTLATSLSYLFPKYRFYFLSGAALFSISRIFLLGHYLSDIFGTVAIALLISAAVHHFIQTITRNISYETS